ncbi:MAG: TerC family protein [Candidatus Koribacter versatilis]|uniref:TerC family protein n=1 Tax=Candidatus Korobacter versatilis TaxID=658062 RepID=A0A932A8X7_9BACT|nr:TerC family protein [Candidatus Koribacter versatilis]
MPQNWIFWLAFNLFVLAMLALDLGVFHRKEHVVKFKEALAWTAVWVTLAGVFAVLLYFFGHTMAASARPNHELSLEFLTGYLIEESLSVDNLFVFLLIFRYFKVPKHDQHTVLFWGIIGALVMRAIFIFAGIGLINRFHWLIYVFGGFLVYTGIKLFKQEHAEVHPERNPLVNLFRNVVPVTRDYHGKHFFIRQESRLYATPLLIVLLIIETTDVVFAVDSIPAVLAITREPFIVFTSNVFAILGLRSLYFALAGLMEIFHFLHYGLAVILTFIGVKMIASSWIEIPIWIALGFVVAVLAASVIASIMIPHKKSETEKLLD